ncbi:MAG TPA: hypothetical protein VI386_12760 [Candidatus Sulfotelmatobacter sp.]
MESGNQYEQSAGGDFAPGAQRSAFSSHGGGGQVLVAAAKKTKIKSTKLHEINTLAK